MPLIRCPRCSQPYDIPPAVAVKLPSSLAKCTCGEWLCGNREALISRVLGDGELEEIPLEAYRLDEPEPPSPAPVSEPGPFDLGSPRNLRVIARGADAQMRTVFSIDQVPLRIGRHGSHVELDDAELSILHCEIARRGDELVLRDCGSHTGTFLDGEPVDEETVIPDGTHLIRVGKALICVEPTDEEGTAVEPIEIREEDLLGASPALMKKLAERGARAHSETSVGPIVLVCLEGPCAGREFEVPSGGGVVGREGSVRVPDEYLSRKHFEFFRDTTDGSLRLRDLGSRNGTFLNTLPAQDTRVSHGDEIRAGFSRFRIEERGSDDPEPGDENTGAE